MKLSANTGTPDRLIRLSIAVVIAVLSFTGTLSGLPALLLGILAVVFVVTSIISFCPPHVPLGLATSRK